MGPTFRETCGDAMQITEGVMVVDKPAGMTSARAVSAVKRLLPPGTKVGHAGTLDPFATGVLLVLIGRATKICEKMMSQPKTYAASIKLGAVTDTDDVESPERAYNDPGIAPTQEQIEHALTSFVGAIAQRPPIYSAIKVAGKRACDRVREGQQHLELQPRTVHVYSIQIDSYDWPLLKLVIDCGRGTYIRSIARDLGAALDVGGYLAALRRTRIGRYTIDRAVRLDQLDRQNIGSYVLPSVV
jgi:tRNA pseudouridine55 synthase